MSFIVESGWIVGMLEGRGDGPTAWFEVECETRRLPGVPGEPASLLYRVLTADVAAERLSRLVRKEPRVRVVFAGQYDVTTTAAGTLVHEVVAQEIGVSLLDPLIGQLAQSGNEPRAETA